jgi:hypothetical protein
MKIYSLLDILLDRIEILVKENVKQELRINDLNEAESMHRMVEAMKETNDD